MSDFLSQYMMSDTSGNIQTQEELQEITIEKIRNSGYNLEEIEPILKSDDKHQLIEAIAGAGKTTVLSFKVLNDIKSGRSFGKRSWVNTFLKSGAEDLKRDFIEKSNNLKLGIAPSNVKFSTLHSEFYQLLNELGIPVTLIDKRTENKIYQKTATDFKLGLGKKLDPDELSLMKLLVGRWRNSLGNIEDDVFREPEVLALGIAKNSMDLLIRDMKNQRKAFGVVDFEDLQDLLYQFIYEEPIPVLINAIKGRYKYIYLDEAQDISKIQYAILKLYFEEAEQVFMVGDSDQSIYSWRGSDVEIITNIYPSEYNPKMMKLTTNYRVPEDILMPAARTIKNNKTRIDKNIRAHKPGGIINAYTFANKQAMLRYTVDRLYKDQQNYKQTAVLSGTNLGLTDLAVLLSMQRDKPINFKIGGTLVNLDAIKFAKYWRLAYLFTSNDKMYLTENIRTIAFDLYRGFKAKELETIIRNQGYKLISLDPSEIGGASKHLEQWLSILRNDDPLSDLLRTLEYLRWREKTGKKSAYTDGNITTISLFISMIKFNQKIKTPEDFIYEVDMQIKLLKLNYDKEKAPILLTTAFDFKGKEAEHIVVLEDTDYNFPRKKSAASQFEEERRLHYIACTRATKEETITTIDGHHSPFLKEMGIQVRRPLISSMNNTDLMTDEDFASYFKD